MPLPVLTSADTVFWLLFDRGTVTVKPPLPVILKVVLGARASPMLLPVPEISEGTEPMTLTLPEAAAAKPHSGNSVL